MEVQSTSRFRVVEWKISILALLFGTGSWIALTGLWVEMPLLLQQLPEGWSLASYLNMMIQLANIGPLLYWIMSHRFHILNEVSATHIQIWIGMFSCLMLIGFWKKTMPLFGDEEHSVMLLMFTFGLALVDATSSVTFLPFMARFDSSYMTPYLVGEGLSGFIPCMVVLLQGVGNQHQPDCPKPTTMATTMIILNDTKNHLIINKTSKINSIHQPRFSIEVFFTSLLATLSISYLAFLGLSFLSFAKKEQERIKQTRITKMKFDDDNLNSGKLLWNQNLAINRNHNDLETMVVADKYESERQIDQYSYYYLLCLVFWNCFTTFGFMTPLQPFSALPYSNDVLHFTVILCSLSYPVGCFFAMLVEQRSVKSITILSVLASVLAIYITISSLMSPKPPFAGTEFHWIGSCLMVVSWIGFITLASYAKTMITLVICDFNSSRGMFWVGMNTQFGGALGAFAIFMLINYTNLFNQCIE